jgi:hypothetical protein
MQDEAADLLRPGENHVGSVSYHTGSHEGWRALLRTIVADVGLEVQITLPEIAHLPIRGGDLVGEGHRGALCLNGQSVRSQPLPQIG